jgi:hypothetical protein
MSALGQPGTTFAEWPPACSVLATAPFEDHTLVVHDAFFYLVVVISTLTITSERQLAGARTAGGEWRP